MLWNVSLVYAAFRRALTVRKADAAALGDVIASVLLPLAVEKPKGLG